MFKSKTTVLVGAFSFISLFVLPINQIYASDDMSLSKAVGNSTDSVLISGIRRNGKSLVGKMVRQSNGKLVLVAPITASKPPVISNPTSEVITNSSQCDSNFPDEVTVRFDFTDKNSDITGGYSSMNYKWYSKNGSGPFTGGITSIFFPLNSNREVIFTSKTTGYINIRTCWKNVGQITFSPVVIADGDSQKSNELSLPTVFIPASSSFSSQAFEEGDGESGVLQTQ